MVFADIIYTKITTDKDFTSFDEKIFETNYYLKKFSISEFVKTSPKDSKGFNDSNRSKDLNIHFSPFSHISRWKIQAPNEVIFENVLDERQYFFLESLTYLMKTYFKSMNMKLNGSLYGTESIFGDEFEYEIKDNIIIKIKP
jgi:hypothetical protein